jgi:hypothetical protein
MYNLLNIYGNGSRHIRMLFNNNTIIVFVISFILPFYTLFYAIIYYLTNLQILHLFFYSHIYIYKLIYIDAYFY